jgi:AcrR family transcriptional regulator
MLNMDFSKRQTAIIHAATELIGMGGIQQLTTKALAEKMNFSEPALYRHFKNKTDILSSVLHYFNREISAELDDVLKTAKSGMFQLKQMIQFQFNHFSQHPAIVRVIFAETDFQYEEKLSEAVRTIQKNKRSRVLQMIRKGQKDGSIRKDVKAGQLATVFMGSMRFTILQWRLSNFESDLRKEGMKLSAALGQLLSPK